MGSLNNARSAIDGMVAWNSTKAARPCSIVSNEVPPASTCEFHVEHTRTGLRRLLNGSWVDSRVTDRGR